MDYWGGGGGKGYVAPPSQIIGGGGAGPLAPSSYAYAERPPKRTNLSFLTEHEPEGCHKSHGEKQVLNATDCVRAVLHPGCLKPETASQGTKLYLNEHIQRIGGKNAISIGKKEQSKFGDFFTYSL